MEDLGQISINVKDLGGGGGGGGSPGGGAGGGRRGAGTPGGGAGMADAAEPPVYLTAYEKRLKELRASLQTGATPRLSLEQLRRGFVRGGEGRTAAIGQVGEIGAQFKDFFQRPTVSGFSSLMSTGSTAGKAMAGLASVVGVALPIIGAVVAVVGLTIAAFKMLKAAAEQVAERIREVARYSGELTSAVVGERIAELNRQLHEAAENGKAYAAVQRSATVAGNAWGAMMVNVNKITSGFAVLWHSITAGFAQSVGPAIKAFGYVGEWFATNFGAGGNFDGLTTAFKVITDMGVLLFGGPLALGKIIEWIRLLLVKLGIIADNTKPKSTAAVNDWFRADVHAMTGRAY